GVLEDVHLTSDLRSNSIIVAAPTQAMTLIQAMIRELDRPAAARAEVKVFTLRRGDAAIIANLLQNLFLGGGATTGAAGGLGAAAGLRGARAAGAAATGAAPPPI